MLHQGVQWGVPCLLSSSHTAVPAKTTQRCVVTKTTLQYFCNWSAGQNDMYFLVILYVLKSNSRYRFTHTPLTVNFGFWRQASFCLFSLQIFCHSDTFFLKLNVFMLFSLLCYRLIFVTSTVWKLQLVSNLPKTKLESSMPKVISKNVAIVNKAVVMNWCLIAQ